MSFKNTYLNTFLRFFWPEITSKNFINSTRAFDWCMNCHIWMRKIFRFFFDAYFHPFGENRVKFFSHPNMTIHTSIDSPCRV
jgi:hypothetical protein